MAILTSVRYLMAPGSEHLRQMGKSSAVGNGRQGRQQEASSFRPLVRSCSGHQRVAARNPSQCQALGATQQPELPLGPAVPPPRGPRSCCRPVTSLLGRRPRLERCALLSTHIDTDTGRGLWEKLFYTESPFSGVQGF